ncbi:MAG: RagB/SusD family nutrient uptake outer membrane protein [Prevotella sp.]|nr:RagB/SusD family nutrient uptake outer membrane protein [Prevotellaceae bacterium]
MKKYILYTLLSAATFTTTASLVSCDEDKFLEEKPLDFMGGDNSYSTAADFDAAVNGLYNLVRQEFYCGSYGIMNSYLLRTDLAIQADPPMSNLAEILNPTADLPKWHWENLYKLVAQANTVLTRVQNSSMTDDLKRLYEAKGKLFRAMAYRTLCYYYGGVPLVLEEVSAPKTDYTRASKEETLAQAIEDAKYAAENLPDISAVKDGEISAPAAQVLLAELYLAAGNNQAAADAASKVIANPALALMKERFGSRAAEEGDVYWDLFRRENQNRASGNTEGIWVVQIEPNVTGGAGNTGNAFWVNGDFWQERWFGIQTGLFRFVSKDGTQLSPFLWPIGDYTGGRGIGNYYNTQHYFLTIWGGKDSYDYKNDIRNSKYNYPRSYKFNNPDFVAKYGDLFGDEIDIMNLNLPEGWDMLTGEDKPGITSAPNALPNRYMGAYQTKCTSPYNHPEAQYANKSTWTLTGSAGKTYQDQYLFRLPEAYLLRAEAYVKLGQKDKAAQDINVIRRRAHASDATANQMDMDYILDERLREYGIEEQRQLTLSRTGKMTERVKKYNPYYSAAHSADGKDYDDHYSLFPIPQSFIEANTDAKIEQNPGY